MKKYFAILLFIFFHQPGHAQIFKRLKQKVKSEVDYRADRKASQEINKGLDSLLATTKKTVTKKEPDGNSTTTPAPKKNDPNSSISASGPKQDAEDDQVPKDGFITLKLSADKIFTGGSILISGESVMYKNYKEVEITVKGPSVTDTRKITLTNDGKYFAEWIASNITGDYTVTVKSSDKKASQSATCSVEDLELIFDDEWPGENIRETKKAESKLEDAVDLAETGIGPNDKAELDKKMAEVKGKVADALKLFKDLNTAAKQITKLVRSGKKLSPNLAGNLSALNNSLTDQARQMKKVTDIADHKPQDNTTCEYLVMVNEACAAFSAFTNFWSKSLKTILLNITLDKGVPKVAEAINSKTVNLSSPNDFLMKEPAKIFATAYADAESLTTKLGTAGFAGDITQFATDFLLKKYCGIFKGEIKHDYTIDFKNKDGVTWWKYGVVMQGALTLRYPKEGSKGKIIKMKGNIEGNATKFTFYENVEADDSFQEGTKGKIEVVELRVIKPPAVPFVTSLNDPAGFGAVARTLVTPACFNITLDAEYDVDANKIKIFLNNSLIDFSPAVVNQLIFLEIGADLFPYIKRMMFPIHKALLTMGSVVRSHNEFTVDKDSKGNLSFTGKANKHIGDKSSAIVSDLNFTISAKKE